MKEVARLSDTPVHAAPIRKLSFYDWLRQERGGDEHAAALLNMTAGELLEAAALAALSPTKRPLEACYRVERP